MPDDGCPEVENDLSKDYTALMKQAKSVAQPGQSVWDSLAGVRRSHSSARPLPCFWQRFISVGAGLASGSATRDNPIIQSHIANAAEFNTAGPVTQLNGITYEGDNAFSGSEEVFLNGNQSGAVRFVCRLETRDYLRKLFHRLRRDRRWPCCGRHRHLRRQGREGAGNDRDGQEGRGSLAGRRQARRFDFGRNDAFSRPRDLHRFWPLFSSCMLHDACCMVHVA